MLLIVNSDDEERAAYRALAVINSLRPPRPVTWGDTNWGCTTVQVNHKYL